jgi:hypothetical protein
VAFLAVLAVGSSSLLPRGPIRSPFAILHCSLPNTTTAIHQSSSLAAQRTPPEQQIDPSHGVHSFLSVIGLATTSSCLHFVWQHFVQKQFKEER